MVHHADYTNFNSNDRRESLELLLQHYEALSSEQDNWVVNLSNASSLIWYAYHSLGVPVNWSGFYLTSDNDQLLLGPFQGKVACQSIKFGRGVCGKAASDQATQVVPDVNKHPDHIACDGETKSEVVVPLIKDDKTLGVIDIDCLDLQGFGEIDKEILEKLAASIVKSCKF